jgi:hypothetical protein
MTLEQIIAKSYKSGEIWSQQQGVAQASRVLVRGPGSKFQLQPHSREGITVAVANRHAVMKAALHELACAIERFGLRLKIFRPFRSNPGYPRRSRPTILIRNSIRHFAPILFFETTSGSRHVSVKLKPPGQHPNARRSRARQSMLTATG